MEILEFCNCLIKHSKFDSDIVAKSLLASNLLDQSFSWLILFGYEFDLDSPLSQFKCHE